MYSHAYLAKNAFPAIRVKVTTQNRRLVVTLPKDFAARLGIIEGISELEVTIRDGELVYRLAPSEDDGDIFADPSPQGPACELCGARRLVRCVNCKASHCFCNDCKKGRLVKCIRCDQNLTDIDVCAKCERVEEQAL